MSMTAYVTPVFSFEATSSTRLEFFLCETRDTRPSGERESGSYSGTRQRNRIQFGPS